jgi:sugar lactone lactonase YvrE
MYRFLIAIGVPILCHAQLITTVAGGGFNPANGVAATSAGISATQGIAVDASGNFFYWDANKFGVREVTAAGIINTVAGNGTQSLAIAGSIGDGGPATSAGFGPPGLFAGIAVDAAGNLYVSDPGNKRVRKVDTKGIMTTFAGGGAADTPATKIGFGQPSGLAVDSAGNLYIADILIGRVYKATPSGAISVVAGGGSGGDGGQATSAAIISPYGVAVDSQGNLYIAESSVLAMRVRKVTPAGIISTVAGGTTYGYSGDGGPATSAQLFGIEGIAIDNSEISILPTMETIAYAKWTTRLTSSLRSRAMDILAGAAITDSRAMR